MDLWVQQIIAVLLTVLASNGFWAWLQARRDKRDGNRQLMRGIAHDLIIKEGEKAIEAGWITSDEYENLNDYLYKPYKALGGNGSAERVMEQVKRLPVRNPHTGEVRRSDHA